MGGISDVPHGPVGQILVLLGSASRLAHDASETRSPVRSSRSQFPPCSGSPSARLQAGSAPHRRPGPGRPCSSLGSWAGLCRLRVRGRTATFIRLEAATVPRRGSGQELRCFRICLRVGRRVKRGRQGPRGIRWRTRQQGTAASAVDRRAGGVYMRWGSSPSIKYMQPRSAQLFGNDPHLLRR